MLINTFGLHWKREDVFWGKPGTGGGGRLLGIPSAYKKWGKVDFKEQVGFYALYDEQFQLVYVGQTGSGTQSLLARLRQHLSDHLAGRWARFSWFGRKCVEDDGTLNAQVDDVKSDLSTFLNQVEAVLIAVSEPRYNKQGGRFVGAERYLQYRDEKLGQSQEEMLLRIYKNLES